MRYEIVYGIACIEESEGRKETVAEVSGITSKEDEIKRLVELCNRNSLSPCQLREIVEDLLDSI